MSRCTNRTESLIFRIADMVLSTNTPTRDTDGYHYFYDPDHTKRPPSGFGRFFKTPKGWSTNPKYQHGALPYDVVKNLTNDELKDYATVIKTNDNPQLAQLGPSKRKLIEKLSFVGENDIEAVERLPDFLFVPINSDNVSCLKAKSCSIDYDRGKGEDNTKYDIYLSINDGNEYTSSKSVVHEIAHLSLLSSPLRNDPEFLSSTHISLTSEFFKFESDFKSRIKKLVKGDEEKTDKAFDILFKCKGRGDRVPKRLNNVSKALTGKPFKTLTQKEASDLGSFMDCLMCASDGEYGFGHSKRYMQEKDRNNPIHEFWAHIGEDYFSPNHLIKKHFDNSASFIRKTMEGLK